MSTVKYKQGQLPALTEERKAELRVLAQSPNSEIDYSDIPALDEKFWTKADYNPFFKPIKAETASDTP